MQCDLKIKSYVDQLLETITSESKQESLALIARLLSKVKNVNNVKNIHYGTH